MTRRAWLVILFLLAALGMACLGQYYRLYLREYAWDAAIFFAAGSALFVRMLLKARAPVPQSAVAAPPGAEARPRWWLVVLAALLAVLAWQQSYDNTFTSLGVLAWWGAVLAFVAAFWTWARSSQTAASGGGRRGYLYDILAVIALIALVAFFRFYQLDNVPPEMNSDHVEKLYDIYDVLNGQYSIYFERNTGREPMQFYLTVALIKLFNTGLTHYSLKLGNAVAGILSVIGVYLLGREIGGRRLGLLAGFFAAVSIWAVATSRIGLRYPFAPAFTSLALWSLLRALRANQRNAWLVAGAILGAGLHGYTAFRLMPVAAVAIIGLHLLARWRTARTEFRRWAAHATLYMTVSALVFLPLGHYMVERPEMFWYRTLTRATDLEHPVTGNPLQVFSDTLTRTLGMFNWTGDEVWVCTIPDAPALDVISGGLLLLGVVYTLVYLGRKRGLLATQLILGGVILLLPSALTLAFPNESPSVVRAGGAMPVVAVLIGLALLHLAGEVQAILKGRAGQVVAGLLVMTLLVGMTALNFHRYFVSYLERYRASAMNTREVSEAVRDYVARGGSFDRVYLKGRAHWLDARAIALQVAQKPGWEVTNVAQPTGEILPISANAPAPKMYIVHPADRQTLELLRAQFTNGQVQLNRSAVPGHDFVFFIVPGDN